MFEALLPHRSPLPYSSEHWARGSPYPERHQSDPQWHDRAALSLDALCLDPLRQLARQDLRVMRRVAHAAMVRSAELDGLSDAELRAQATGLRARLRTQGYTPDAVAESFAVIRAAAARCLGQRHFETQLMAGYALLQGRLAEMATGEGKTFCATLPACTVALAGYPVHVITVNDYLAKRDAEKMKPLYDYLGLSVGVVVQGLEKPLRRQAYAQAITYGTNKELAFDYLRDRVALKGRGGRLHQAAARLHGGKAEGEEALVMRGLYYALVDEADSVFIDEARTPLILSASRGGGEDAADCAAALELAAQLDEGEDYELHLQAHRVLLTEAGRSRLDAYAEERAATLGGVWTSPRAREERLCQALSAIHFYRRDEHYVVAEDKVQIVDESTGRLMPDRSWERGLHQMIEAKEGVKPTPQRETLARLTYQRLFRRYLHLSGMTGTAAEAAREIRTVYGLRVVRVPLNRPSRRLYLPDVLLPTAHAKWEEVAEAARAVTALGRPVLIGTRSVRASEQISAVLQARGIPHALLNAKQDADEAAVVADAGQPGRVTVATNMAGRGTDIELGEGVDEAGGLHVILTEFHDSRRVDRQLFGRSARQGDAGSCQAIVSLEDEVFTVAVPGPTAVLQQLQRTRRLPAGACAALRWLAQWMTERRHTAVRLSNLKQDRQLNQSLAFTGKGE